MALGVRRLAAFPFTHRRRAGRWRLRQDTEHPPSHRARPYLPGTALALTIGALYLATATWSGATSTDVVATALQSWQLAQHGSLTLDAVRSPGGPYVHADGRVVSNRLPGAVLLATPLYRLLGDDNGFRLGPAAITAAFVMTATVMLLFLLLRTLTARRVALAAALLFGFGTSAWSVAADGLWQHGPAMLVLVAAMLALARQNWLLSGLALGGAVMHRPHLGLVAAVIVLWLLPRWKPALTLAAGTSVGTTAFLVYNQLLYGRWTVLGGYADGGIGWGGYGPGPLLYNIAGALVSPQRGLLVYTPALLVLLPGLRAAWHCAPGWVRASAVGGLAYTVTQLALNRFSGGNGFYGYRLTLELVVLATPLLVLAWREWTSTTPVRRATFYALAILSLIVQAAGAVATNPDAPHAPWTRNDFVDVVGNPSAAAVLAAAVVVWWVLLRLTGQALHSPSAR